MPAEPRADREHDRRRGCVPPWGFRGPEGRWPARAKTQAEATETLTYVMKFVRKPTKKHVMAVADPGGGRCWGGRPPLRPWGGVSPFKMRYSIAYKHQSIIGRPYPWEKSCIRPWAPSDHLVPREKQGPSDYQRPCQLSGAL